MTLAAALAFERNVNYLLTLDKRQLNIDISLSGVVMSIAAQNPNQQYLREGIERVVFDHSGLTADALALPEDFLRLLDSTHDATLQCAQLQQTVVLQARRAGNSWAAIGERLGITRQAAQQRFSIEPPGDSAELDSSKLIQGATAFNEMQLLEYEGAQGYHLTGFGPWFLSLQSSNQQWEHRREIALTIHRRRDQLEKAGWTYVGAWFPFHYFKRPR